MIPIIVSLLKNREDNVFNDLVYSISRLLRCDASRLVQEDPISGERKTISRYPGETKLDRFSNRAIDRPKEKSQTVLLHDVDWKNDAQPRQSLERNLVSSVLCAPLHSEGTIFGYLYLDRDQDILLLAEFFVHRYCEQFGIERKRLSTDARNKLLKYDWPGNIRELENVIQKACLLSEEKKIDEKDIVLPKAILKETTIATPPGQATIKEFRAAAERNIIEQTLKKTGGNVSQTAKLLDIDRKWLIRRRMIYR